MTQPLRLVRGDQEGRAVGPPLPGLPPLTDDEIQDLRSSIERDGVQYPVLLDRHGDVIDGNNRRRITASLGVPCPEQVLDVDDETADRLRLSLNLARRYTRLSTLDKHLLLAALADKYKEKAKADARERQAEAGRDNGQGIASAPVALKLSNTSHQADDDIVAAIRDEAASYGVSLSTSAGNLRRARMTRNLPESLKDRIRRGEISLSAAAGYSYPKHAGSRAKPPRPAQARRVPSRQDREEAAANRDAISERAYQAMKTAPPGAQNNPMFWRASKVEALIGELSEIDPEVAAGQLLDPAFRYFTGYSREWWSRFTEACEKRLEAERPDLEPIRRKPGRAPWAESGLDSR